VSTVCITVDSGRVTQIYAVASPQKLTQLDRPAELPRRGSHRLPGRGGHPARVADGTSTAG